MSNCMLLASARFVWGWLGVVGVGVVMVAGDGVGLVLSV